MMARQLWWHAIVSCLLIALACGTAFAQTNTSEAPSASAKKLASQRFREAKEAYQEGRYAAAASLFEASDRLSPHANMRFNAAAAWEDAGETPRAATAYEAALAQGTLAPESEKTARERLNALKSGLAHVRILQPLGAFVTVDHVQRTPVPTSFYLRPGNYEIITEYRGTRTKTQAEVVAGQGHVIKPEVPFETEPPPPPELPPTPEPIPPAPKDDTSSQKTWAWISIGAGIALSGAAVIMGVNTLAAKDAYKKTGYSSRDAQDRLSSRKLATNVLWGGAVATGATGVILLLTTPTIEF